MIARRPTGGYLDLMNEVTRILSAMETGDPHAAGDLLPFVYDELRRLAAAQMACEKPGQTLDATALVHEAYLRLVGPADDRRWQNRGHFFAAAAEAMRRILVEQARRKKTDKHGGGRRRVDLPEELAAVAGPSDDLVGQAGEVTQLHEFRPARIRRRQPGQGLIQGQQVLGRGGTG